MKSRVESGVHGALCVCGSPAPCLLAALATLYPLYPSLFSGDSVPAMPRTAEDLFVLVYMQCRLFSAVQTFSVICCVQDDLNWSVCVFIHAVLLYRLRELG